MTKRKDFDPHDAVDFIARNASQLAQAKANRVMIEESMRVVKSREMKKFADLPVNAQEREAYASGAYSELLAGLGPAVETETTLYWQMVAAQLRIDVWRSENATNRRLERATV